jgi:dCTP deaminase
MPMLHGLEEGQIQIASFDCRLGDIVYAMKSAALPQNETVADLIKRYKRYDFALSMNQEHVLERGVCYLIPLKEHLTLGNDLRVVFSPKSSTGRCDVFVRVVTDHSPFYDKTPFGYSGRLYLEVIPISFNIRIKEGLELTQGRVMSRTTQPITNEEISVLHSKYGIMRDGKGDPVSNAELDIRDNGLYYRVDLDRDVVGFRSEESPIDELDLTRVEQNPARFWTPIFKPRDGALVLNPGRFYLLTTKERTVIPPEVCGEIVPFDLSSGELRPHYAGFFDNGFGMGSNGTTGVLEIRCQTVPFRIVDGQPICRMRFFKTLEIPTELYGGHYTKSGPSLSKHFMSRFDVWEEKYHRKW